MAIDYEVLFAEPYDPCAILAQLRPVYMKLVVEGAGAQRIKFRDRDVEFGARDSKGLATMIRQLESDCAAKTGRRTNMAITAGALPGCRGGPFTR